MIDQAFWDTVEVQRFKNVLANSSSSAYTNGLVMNSAFHFFANSLSVSPEEVVKRATGIFLSSSACFIYASVSLPFMPGMFTSRITKQGKDRLRCIFINRSIASTPLET